MFITPMPPTSSEMPAIPASSTVSVLSTDVAAEISDAWVVMVKSAALVVVMLCSCRSVWFASWYAADRVEALCAST